MENENQNKKISVSPSSVTSVVRKERGSSMVETALLVTLVAAGCFASIQVLGQRSSVAFEKIEDNLAQGGLQ